MNTLYNILVFGPEAIVSTVKTWTNMSGPLLYLTVMVSQMLLVFFATYFTAYVSNSINRINNLVIKIGALCVFTILFLAVVLALAIQIQAAFFYAMPESPSILIVSAHAFASIILLAVTLYFVASILDLKYFLEHSETNER